VIKSAGSEAIVEYTLSVYNTCTANIVAHDQVRNKFSPTQLKRRNFFECAAECECANGSAVSEDSDGDSEWNYLEARNA
jgi:hypothetical protein